MLNRIIVNYIRLRLLQAIFRRLRTVKGKSNVKSISLLTYLAELALTFLFERKGTKLKNRTRK